MQEPTSSLSPPPQRTAGEKHPKPSTMLTRRQTQAVIRGKEMLVIRLHIHTMEESMAVKYLKLNRLASIFPRREGCDASRG